MDSARIVRPGVPMTTGSDRLAAELKVESLSGPARALAEEAVRIKARLDSLDLWISGDHDTWFELAERWKGSPEVVINAPLVEARQQALAFRAVVSELTKLQAVQDPPAAPVTSTSDELRKRREERLAQRSGA